jgi:hypothetical protein
MKSRRLHVQQCIVLSTFGGTSSAHQKISKSQTFKIILSNPSHASTPLDFRPQKDHP